MRAIRRILTAAAITAIAAVLSACAFLPAYRDPERIEIGGEAYVSGFYENLWPDGIAFGEDDPPAFETEYRLWWEVMGAPFSLYCAQNKEALYWNPTIYCKESESEEIGAYYADTGNFDYSMGLYGDSHKDERIKLNGADTALLEKAISLNARIQENAGKGLLTGKKDFSQKRFFRHRNFYTVCGSTACSACFLPREQGRLFYDHTERMAGCGRQSLHFREL